MTKLPVTKGWLEAVSSEPLPTAPLAHDTIVRLAAVASAALNADAAWEEYRIAISQDYMHDAKFRWDAFYRKMETLGSIIRGEKPEEE